MKQFSNTLMEVLVGPGKDYLVSIAQQAQAEEILLVLEQTAAGLAAAGKNHWNGKHTIRSILEGFSDSQILVVRDSSGTAIATVTISAVPPSFHGESALKFWALPDAKAAYIRRLAVVPSLQKYGIASRLLSLAEEHARQSGFEFARLDTDPTYPEIVEYYNKRGYQMRGVREEDVRPFFEKALNANFSNDFAVKR